MYLTFQEYFEHLNTAPERWGKPLAALLGALDAQMGLGIASIGGKDSMSGSFEGLDVPPTLVSFATAIGNTANVMSPEFKKANSSVVILKPQYKDGMPEIGSLLSIYKIVEQMIDEGKVLAAATPGYGGVAEALFKMCVGNHVGLSLSRDINLDDLFKPCYGAVILELLDASAGEFLGSTTVDYVINVNGENIDLQHLQDVWDQMVKWQPTEKTTIDGKEIEIPKYFEIEDDKFGKIVFGEESFQGNMMTAEKQILEGTAAIKTLESIYADEKLSAEIKKINADACSGMAQAAYYYAAGKTQEAEAKMLEVKKRTEEATAELRELQYWTEIANTIIKLAQVVGNLTIGGKTGKLIREYTEKKMGETPPKNSTTVTQHYDPEMQFKGLDKTVTTKW